jgi:hypothetical protein
MTDRLRTFSRRLRRTGPAPPAMPTLPPAARLAHGSDPARARQRHGSEPAPLPHGPGTPSTPIRHRDRGRRHRTVAPGAARTARPRAVSATPAGSSEKPIESALLIGKIFIFQESSKLPRRSVRRRLAGRPRFGEERAQLAVDGMAGEMGLDLVVALALQGEADVADGRAGAGAGEIESSFERAWGLHRRPMRDSAPETKSEI